MNSIVSWVFLGHPNQFFLSKMNERTVIIVVGFWSSLLVWQEMIFLLFWLVIINLHHLINAPYSWIMRSPGQKKWWLTDSMYKNKVLSWGEIEIEWKKNPNILWSEGDVVCWGLTKEHEEENDEEEDTSRLWGGAWGGWGRVVGRRGAALLPSFSLVWLHRCLAAGWRWWRLICCWFWGSELCCARLELCQGGSEQDVRWFRWWRSFRGRFHCQKHCGHAFAVAARAVEQGRHVFIFSSLFLEVFLLSFWILRMFSS